MSEPTPPPAEDDRLDDDYEPVEAFEVVDGLPVLVEVRPLEPARPPAAVALAQTAAVAATGFMAGVATAAVLGRRRQRRLGRPAAGRPAGSLEVVASRSYLVDVHVLERRG